jgi:hypothetical protein
MNQSIILVGFTAISLAIANVSFGEPVIIGPGDATPENLWGNGPNNLSVIYAEVVDFEKPGGPNALHLKPLATLAGRFDSAYCDEILVDAWIGRSVGSYIPKAPDKGAKVVVLVLHGVNDRKKQYTFVPDAIVNVFPKNAHGYSPPLFEVTGFDDPKVTETIENLRKLRGKQREEAEKQAAEQKPSADQKSKP